MGDRTSPTRSSSHHETSFGFSRVCADTGGMNDDSLDELRKELAALKAEDRNEKFGVAVVLGAGPYIDFASQAKIPHTQEKLGVAGALAGHPIELVPCETVDAHVPADAEIVIEGHFVPRAREPLLLERPVDLAQCPHCCDDLL